MVIIDTHTHVAVRELLSPAVPAISRRMPVLPLEDLLTLMDRHGVAHAILVQWGECWDHHYLARCIADHPDRLTGVACVDVRRADAINVLQNLINHHGLKGVRFGATDRAPVDQPMRMWETAAELDIVVSASARNTRDFADGLEPVLQRLPQLKLRIEHLARCPYESATADEHFNRVVELARYPNVYVNIDGFLQHDYPYHFRHSVYPFEKYQPFARRVLDAFGPQRCMWGSEFPFLNNPYDIGIRFLREACTFLSTADLAWVLGASAIRLWNLPHLLHAAERMP